MNLPAILAYSAVAFVVARAGIFRWLRERGPRGWRDFISCPLCVGFWVGAGLLIASKTLSEPLFWRSWAAPVLCSIVLDALLTGALTGAIALLYTAVLDALPLPAPTEGKKTDQ